MHDAHFLGMNYYVNLFWGGGVKKGQKIPKSFMDGPKDFWLQMDGIAINGPDLW